jgi:dihydrofolate reductase
MGKVIVGATLSLDGFMADRNGDLSPLYPDLDALRQSAYLQEQIRNTGAAIMGRYTYDLGLGDLSDYEFQVPIFVLTHNPPAEGPKGQNDRLKVYFVTEGIDAAVERAKAAAGEKDVQVIGGADVSRQILERGLADELGIGIAPVLLGDGLRFFDGFETEDYTLEKISTQEAAGATYMQFKLVPRHPIGK